MKTAQSGPTRPRRAAHLGLEQLTETGRGRDQKSSVLGGAGRT